MHSALGDVKVSAMLCVKLDFNVPVNLFVNLPASNLLTGRVHNGYPGAVFLILILLWFDIDILGVRCAVANVEEQVVTTGVNLPVHDVVSHGAQSCRLDAIEGKFHLPVLGFSC
jgi:hypothetical protein